ncbi:MAG: hypothetical protein EBZ67_04290 [Chitinophagia bacterium]|nr:hypothetical protein [Chitinophagia bacterium]
MKPAALLLLCHLACPAWAGGHPSSVLQFAEREWKTWLGTAAKGWQPSFQTDSRLADGSFAFRIERTDKGRRVLFTGSDEAAVVHALHGFLEHVGFRFGIDVTRRPNRLRIDTLRNGYHLTVPHTRWRGVRQHVNFPMDISSYPIDEARAYLENLMRLRFNKIAVHSYPNLWHEVRTGDSTEHAGDFFYNRSHRIPQHPVIRPAIRFNRDWFCIPDIERFYTDRLARSREAVAWMRALLAHAKSIGLRVQFSIEPRLRGDAAYILDNARSALRDYPMIDDLEIMTEETGGWGRTCTDTAVRQSLVKHFGEVVLQDSRVTRCIQPRQTDLDVLVEQLGRNLQAVKTLGSEAPFRSGGKGLAVGIYCTMPAYVDLAYHLVRTKAPGTEVTIMPGHGSRRTAAHLSRVRMDADDLARTTVYSWLEFDGLMFTQQNAIAGIEALFQQLDTLSGGRPLHAVLFNHWRTAENALTARYAAISCLQGAPAAERFYREEAQREGMPSPRDYAYAMHRLEELDRFSTEELPNIGFCWIGAWLNGGPYLSMDPRRVERAALGYDSVRQSIRLLQAETKYSEGKQRLAFLENRLSTSISYLNTFRIAGRLRELKVSDSDSAAYRRQVTAICDEALQEFERYMRIHAGMLPDRGCEGTLINLWHGPVYGLKVLRQRLAAVPMDMPPQRGEGKDGPPLPILTGRN